MLPFQIIITFFFIMGDDAFLDFAHSIEDAFVLASYSTEDGWIVDEYPEWDGARVSYWMPLPDAPKEVRE